MSGDEHSADQQAAEGSSGKHNPADVSGAWMVELWPSSMPAHKLRLHNVQPHSGAQASQ